MARPLRIEFCDGLYHVTARGNQREAIYLIDADRQRWLDLLGEVCTRYHWLCHAYCLMDNHYHLIVQTMDANLSAGMRQLNGVYTQWHNRAHSRVGHVFQGRFKAIVVQRDAYLLELARYVVLNPVRAGMCSTPEDWPWSSYRAMLGQVPQPPWLQREWLLSQFGSNPPLAVQAYVDHVHAGVGLPSVWQQLQGQLYLGDAAFVESVGEKIERKSFSDTEIPRAQRRAQAPSLGSFVTTVDVKVGKKGWRQRRNIAIRQAHETGCYSMKDIAHAFGLHYATVSRAVNGT